MSRSTTAPTPRPLSNCKHTDDSSRRAGGRKVGRGKRTAGHKTSDKHLPDPSFCLTHILTYSQQAHKYKIQPKQPRVSQRATQTHVYTQWTEWTLWKAGVETNDALVLETDKDIKYLCTAWQERWEWPSFLAILAWFLNFTPWWYKRQSKFSQVWGSLPEQSITHITSIQLHGQACFRHFLHCYLTHLVSLSS